MLHAFDPGLSLGWAFFEGDRASSRLLDLRANCEGAVYARARSKLLEIIAHDDVVGVEAAILPNKVTISSRLVLFGIRAIIVQVCYERMARVVEIEPHRWRSHFMGVVQAPKQVPRQHRRAWLKARAQDAVRQCGWGDVSSDEADAIGILTYLRSSLDPNFGVKSTPLFAHGR